jgi:hypothetical protein
MTPHNIGTASNTNKQASKYNQLKAPQYKLVILARNSEPHFQISNHSNDAICKNDICIVYTIYIYPPLRGGWGGVKTQIFLFRGVAPPTPL